MPHEAGIEALVKALGVPGVLALIAAFAAVLYAGWRVLSWREGILQKQIDELADRQEATDEHRARVTVDLALLKESAKDTKEGMQDIRESVTALHRRLDARGFPAGNQS